MNLDFDSFAHLVRDPVARITARATKKHESITFLSSFHRAPVFSAAPLEPVKFLSEARRVEAGLIPALCFEVVHSWHSTAPHDTERLKHQFTTAIEQMICGTTMRQAVKLAKRTIFEAQQVLHKHKGGYFAEGKDLSWEKIGMVVYFLACDLTADGTFDLVEGSAMHLALEDMRAAAMDKMHPKQIASAEKQAVKFREFLGGRPQKYFKR